MRESEISARTNVVVGFSCHEERFPRERPRHPLLFAVFLVTMIAMIAIYFAGSVISEVQAASVQDPGQGPEQMDHETIN
jgi:hypothetical protein